MSWRVEIVIGRGARPHFKLHCLPFTLAIGLSLVTVFALGPGEPDHDKEDKG
jgi:hypothetical protein